MVHSAGWVCGLAVRLQGKAVGIPFNLTLIGYTSSLVDMSTYGLIKSGPVDR